MTKNKWKYFLPFSLLVILFCAFAHPLKAQNNDEEIEVYLSFNYRSVISTVVVAYYKNDTFYLPYKELFNLLGIDHNVNLSGGNILLYGRFLEEQTYYQLDLISNKASMGDQEMVLPADDFLVKELDYFLKPKVFADLFGLNFIVDFNNLSLGLETNIELPVMKRLERQRKRERIQQSNSFRQLDYPVAFGRNRKVFGGGFLDYNLSSINSNSNNVYLYNTALGFEVLGGDIQGSINGNYSSTSSNIDANNIRWRYAIQDSPLLTSMQVGQTFSTGLIGNAFTGVKLSNEPFEPRRLYDEFTIEGNTIPQSEVELYVNNSLVDFQQSDELGNYRFITPLTYGNSKYDLKIFGPTGQVREVSQRIQVPFTFLPPGEVNYNLNIGELDNTLLGTDDRGMIAQGDVIAGVNNWLTAEAGVEYFENFHGQVPTFTGGLSARIFNKYLLTTQIANDAFFRANSSVIYANSASLNFNYTEFIADDGIYNPSGQIREFQGSAFYPFSVAKLPLNLRIFGSRSIRSSTPFNRYRIDLNSRIGRLNIRTGLTNSRSGESILELSDNARMTLSATYNVSRFRTVPKILRSMFLRGEISFIPMQNEVEQLQFLASRNIFESGNIQLNVARNFRFQFNSVSMTFVVDFNKTRINSTFRNTRNTASLTNTVRGSVGLDANNNNFIFSSRNQVGRSASAVRLFVDYDGNGTYSDGDELIDNNALRIDRTGSTELVKDGIVYITQMQPYFKYNMEINKGAIENPLLVPLNEKFGVISDPNYFKPIEIPFYSSGIVSGMVERKFEQGNTKGIGGLRLFLTNTKTGAVEELRTFSDGGFYSYEVPPGQYELTVDSTQLEILNVRSVPEKIDVEIEALAQGDFEEGLSFTLIPKEKTKEEEKEDPATLEPGIGVSKSQNGGTGLSLQYNISVDSMKFNECRYEMQFAAFKSSKSAQKLATNLQKVNGTAYVVYNKKNDLYAVRSGVYQVLNLISEKLSEHTNRFPDISIVHRCYGSLATIYRGSATIYHIQLGAFSSEKLANNFLNSIGPSYQNELFIVEDPEKELYKVRAGPYSTNKEVETHKKQLLNQSAVSGIYTVRENYMDMINVEFGYRLQLGRFETADMAVRYAIRIEGDFNQKSTIVIDEQGSVLLMLQKTFNDWETIKQVKENIERNEGYQTPVIHLIERKINGQ